MSVEPPGVTSILQSVEKRGETDTRPSYFVHVLLGPLLVLAALLIVVGVIYTLLGQVVLSADWITARLTSRLLGGLVALVGLSVIAAMVLGYWGLYRVIQRRNEHFARDRILRQGLIDYCRRLAEQHDGDRVDDNLEAMERLHNEALMEETEQPTAIHIALQAIVIPFWWLYIFYFLLKDFPEHSRRQARFVREARSLFENVGRPPEEIPPVEPIEEHPFLLALLLVIPPWGAIGFFGVAWWVYEDPPEHFARQAEHEDRLVEYLEEGPKPEAEEAETPSEDDEDEGDDAARTEGAPSGRSAEEDEPAPEPEFTIWECSECSKKYKVPPKRPVRVTCKNCDNKEILEE